jgi:hypothetical protein
MVQTVVPYTLWVGTDAPDVYTINVRVPKYTAFYNVMKLAEILSLKEYR